MQQVNENPILGQLVALAAVDVDHPHFAGFVRTGHPHEAACVPGGEVGPAEEASVMTFGNAGEVPGLGTVGKGRAERARVLFGIALDRVGRADPRRAPPDHVVVPSLGKFLFKRQA